MSDPVDAVGALPAMSTEEYISSLEAENDRLKAQVKRLRADYLATLRVKQQLLKILVEIRAWFEVPEPNESLIYSRVKKLATSSVERHPSAETVSLVDDEDPGPAS